MRHIILLCAVTLIGLSMHVTAQAQVPTGSSEGVELVNLNPDPDGEPWIAGGITFEEWNSSIPAPMPSVLNKKGAILAALPSKVDNTTHSAFRPVFNQKGGSCAQASGIGYQYTYEINVLRKLPSNVLRNQYPYDFTYNFLNSGSGARGSMSNDGWSIVKAIGIPDAETYGGFGLGKFTNWISGYEAYYKGMANRLESSFSIKIRTGADILEMKQFLFDHSDGSSAGGILSFAADAKGEKIVNLASGTPDAGKRVLVSFGTSGGHAMTIAGYNDSIRYDYNRDGRYTNDVDLNGDKVIDVRDWEKGAVLMVNSWGTNWGNSGKTYIMYKVLADSKTAGGIWSNSVLGIKINNPSVVPQLTYKVRMTYNPRSSMRIRAGFSTNASASEPALYKSFGRAFSYSGGEFPMQVANGDPIEIGLDVSEFIPKMTTSEAAFFLQIESKSGSGIIKHFSLIDYTSGKPVETVCQQTNVAAKTGTTRLKIVKSSAPLLVVSPNGQEKWEQQRAFNITWSTRDASPVVIELLKDGTFHSTIASSAPATGTFQWEIPESVVSGNDYTVRIHNKADTKVADVSDKAFSIEKRSELRLVTPNTSEYYTKGSSGTITWETAVNGLLRIDLYRHGVLEMRIDSVQASLKSCTWKIPENIPSGFDYRIRITSKDKEWLYDECDSDFGLGFPIVATPYVQSFDNFQSGDTLLQSWEQVKDDDINWTVLKGATPSKTHPQGGGTGPGGDHTNGSGRYIYVEASSPNHPGKEAVLLSPVFTVAELTGAQASFWCHMFSREQNMGALWVDICTDGEWKDSVLYLTGNHGDQWFQQKIDLATYKCSLVQFRFRVLTGTDYDSDVCIDDFSISGGITPVALIRNMPKNHSVVISHNLIRLYGYNGTAKIFTINGKQLLSKAIHSSIESIDVSDLPSGTYLFEINDKFTTFVRRD